MNMSHEDKLLKHLQYTIDQQFLSKKSLIALQNFFRGYRMRGYLEQWEKHTGKNFIDNIDEALDSFRNQVPLSCSDSKMQEIRTMYELRKSAEFNAFVRTYFELCISNLDAMTTISSISKSDEEAFDKYLEVRIAFLERWEKEQAIYNDFARDFFNVSECCKELDALEIISDICNSKEEANALFYKMNAAFSKHCNTTDDSRIIKK